MGRQANFNSRWIVDRKFFDGATWILRYTACSKPKCASCRGSAREPVHGPYWAVYEEIDGRNHVRHHSVKQPLPWGDSPPPSLLPSEADPSSRLNVRRDRREQAARAREQALLSAAEARLAAKAADAELKARQRADRHRQRVAAAEATMRRIAANLLAAQEAGQVRHAARLEVAAQTAAERYDSLARSA